MAHIRTTNHALHLLSRTRVSLSGMRVDFEHLSRGAAAMTRNASTLSSIHVSPYFSTKCSHGSLTRNGKLPERIVSMSLVSTQRHSYARSCGRTPALCRTLSTLPKKGGHIVRYGGENDEDRSPRQYALNVGTAIRTLREELPQFFNQGLCTTSIYASNIRLIEASHTNVALQGKPIYFLLAGAVRWSFKMWFRDIEFEIQSIRVNDRGGRGLGGMDSGLDSDDTMGTTGFSTMQQTSSLPSSTLTDRQSYYSNNAPLSTKDAHADRAGGDQGENEERGPELPAPPATTVTVRWTLAGTTRPSVVLTSSGPTPPPPSSYAGVFVYQFDERGLIDEHRIENIMPSPSPEAIQRAFAWWGWLISRTRPAAAAGSGGDGAGKRLGLGCVGTNGKQNATR